MCKNGHKLLYLYVAGILRVTHERARQPAREEHPISVPLDLTSVQMQPTDSSVARCWLSSYRHCICKVQLMKPAQACVILY